MALAKLLYLSLVALFFIYCNSITLLMTNLLHYLAHLFHHHQWQWVRMLCPCYHRIIGLISICTWWFVRTAFALDDLFEPCLHLMICLTNVAHDDWFDLRFHMLTLFLNQLQNHSLPLLWQYYFNTEFGNTLVTAWKFHLLHEDKFFHGPFNVTMINIQTTGLHYPSWFASL